MKEADYKEQLEKLGIWDEAFKSEVHTLCMMEREHTRAMKEWKATAEDGKNPSMLEKNYQIIAQLRRDILAHRESLGLTPKGLMKLRGKTAPASEGDPLTDALRGLEELTREMTL